MSDCEVGDVFWGSWISPGKRKRKKSSPRRQKCAKHKGDVKSNVDEGGQKKKKKKTKKTPRVKDAATERKEKKKKKKKLSAGVDSFIFTQGQSGASGITAKSDAESSHPEPESKKTRKKRKKVAFDLSVLSDYIRIKRPTFVSSSPKELVLSGTEATRDGVSCSQIAETQQSHTRPHVNDSQCTSDDVNSQDLFITQKTFRASPSEPSSGESCDRGAVTPPLSTTQPQRALHPSGVYTQPDTRLRVSGYITKITNKHLHRSEEEERSYLTANPNKEALSLQRQTETNMSSPGEVNPYLDGPLVVKASPNVTKSKTYPRGAGQRSHNPSKTNTSTQTENFFTAELSSYLNFRRQRRVTVCFEDSEPLDLTLPQRRDRNVTVSGVKGDGEKCRAQKPLSPPDKLNHSIRLPSCSSDVIDVEVKEEEPSGRRRRSVRPQCKGNATRSPQSQSEPKSADTTASSEDGEPPWCTGKNDITQVRAVQMRLNESFFFKTKGEGRSHRPESPLMKLAQGREVKSRKGH